MRIIFIALSAAICFAVASRAMAAAETPGKATADDAHAAFSAGDYAGCLRKIAPLLSSRSPKSDSPERYDLLMLRGESMLRLKQRQGSAAAFEAAASGMKTRGDLGKAAAATALATLVKASPDLTYKPKGRPDAAGIDVVEPSSRQEAMAALFEDLDRKFAPDVEGALRAKTLVPTHALLPRAWELYTVELAAKGSVASTETKLEEVGGHARGLISEELNRLTGRIEQLKDLASEPTWVNGAITYRGLQTDERQELQRMANNLVQIQRTSENARRISRLLGRTGDNWDILLADCAVARDVAEQAYDRQN